MPALSRISAAAILPSRTVQEKQPADERPKAQDEAGVPVQENATVLA